MKNKYKIRFNLSRGVNYMKWKISYNDNVNYYDPNNVTLIMNGCILKNQKKTALKIYNGGYKTVCSWIIADSLLILFDEMDIDIDNNELVYYNPRIEPNWIYKGVDIDNGRFECLVSRNNKVYSK